MSTTDKNIVIAELRDAGCTLAVSTLKRKPLAQLQEMLAELGCGGCDNGEHCGSCECCEAALPADDAVEAEPTPAPVDEPETAPLAPEATYDARGNYNTVFVPLAELLATDPRHAVKVWTEKASTMLVHVHVVGAGSEQFVDLVQQTEADAVEAMRGWMKTLDRKGLTDMEKYNQNRSFLAGYGAGVAKRISGSKAMPVVAFARDMEKALRADALKAGHVAAKEAGK